MRRLALFLAFCFLVSTCFISTTLLTKQTSNTIHVDGMTVFSLPKSIKEIGEDAFMNTAVETVIIPDSTERIEDRAFADIITLVNIIIPKTVKYIGDRALEGSINVTIQTEENSYAAVWAQVHHVTCKYLENTFAKIVKQLMKTAIWVSCLSYVSPNQQFGQRKGKEYWERSLRPQDRPELYPINYRFP